MSEGGNPHKETVSPVSVDAEDFLAASKIHTGVDNMSDLKCWFDPNPAAAEIFELKKRTEMITTNLWNFIHIVKGLKPKTPYY